MVWKTSIKGTWEASDDHVTLTRVEEVYEFNSLTLEKFYTLLLDVEFHVMVLESEMNDEEAMSEEEYFLSILSDSWDSEGNPVDVEEPESLEERKALVVDQMTSMFLLLVDKPAEFGMEEKTFVFFLDREHIEDSLGEFDSFDKFKLIQRAGGVLIPKVEYTEPLRQECAHFVDCIAT